MLVDKNFLTLLYLGSRQRRIAKSPAYFPKRSSGRQGWPGGLSNYAEKRTARKTKDLIAMLLGYGARAARANQPQAHIAINVLMPNGRKAVRLSLARQKPTFAG